MDRRTALRNTGLLTAGAWLGGCASRAATTTEAVPAPRPRWSPVHVSPDRVIRTTVGLRPFRPPGFRVESEKRGGKLIVHNYGHGGGGITLSWGSAHLAVDELFSSQPPPKNVAVLGCGVLGLSTARILQRRGADVVIYAKDLPPHTTSNLSAGQWSPYSVADFRRRTKAFDAQLDRAAELSYRYFQEMVGSHYGVRWLVNYVMSERPFGGPIGGFPFPESRELGAGEHPFPVPHVRQFVTMLIEPPVYLGAVLRDFRIAGGKVVVRAFRDASELQSLSERAIVNCTGLGAKALFADEELTPIKGQLTFVLPQPDVDYITLFGDLYMMPRSDGILLGGTHERGEWSLDVDADAEARVLSGHAEFFGAMRS